jgi:tellurite resistance protein
LTLDRLPRHGGGAPVPAKGKPMIDHHAALIYTTVLVSAADTDMTDAELQIIGDVVNHLPVFRDYDRKRLTKDLKECAQLLGRDDGLEQTLKAIKTALPQKLRETAYAIACDVAAADGETSQEVLRLLEILRHRFGIDRLVAVAIERGAKARFTTV